MSSPSELAAGGAPLLPAPNARTLCGRALRLRCVACGGRPVFVHWFQFLPSCPCCGFRFERGERGYELGSYFINIMLVETVFVLWFVGVTVATWPVPDWDLLQAGVWVLMLGTPFLFFPWSKTLFLAFDVLVRPPTPEDYEAPSERAWRARPGTPSADQVG